MCIERRYGVRDTRVVPDDEMNQLERGQGHVLLQNRLYIRFWKTEPLSIPHRESIGNRPRGSRGITALARCTPTVTTLPLVNTQRSR